MNTDKDKQSNSFSIGNISDDAIMEIREAVREVLDAEKALDDAISSDVSTFKVDILPDIPPEQNKKTKINLYVEKINKMKMRLGEVVIKHIPPAEPIGWDDDFVDGVDGFDDSLPYM